MTHSNQIVSICSTRMQQQLSLGMIFFIPCDPQVKFDPITRENSSKSKQQRVPVLTWEGGSRLLTLKRYRKLAKLRNSSQLLEHIPSP